MEALLQDVGHALRMFRKNPFFVATAIGFNYAYAVLISQTQIRLIAEGYDPTIGILHDREADRGT